MHRGANIPRSTDRCDQGRCPRVEPGGKLSTRPRSDGTDVLRCRPFRALHDVELDPLSFGQGLESTPRDRGVVDEDVLRTVVQADETEALRLVEPLHRTL